MPPATGPCGCLLVTLAMTPLKRLIGRPWPIRFRRMLGLFAFFYAALHLLTYLWLDQGFDWAGDRGGRGQAALHHRRLRGLRAPGAAGRDLDPGHGAAAGAALADPAPCGLCGRHPRGAALLWLVKADLLEPALLILVSLALLLAAPGRPACEPRDQLVSGPMGCRPRPLPDQFFSPEAAGTALAQDQARASRAQVIQQGPGRVDDQHAAGRHARPPSLVPYGQFVALHPADAATGDGTFQGVDASALDHRVPQGIDPGGEAAVCLRSGSRPPAGSRS